MIRVLKKQSIMFFLGLLLSSTVFAAQPIDHQVSQFINTMVKRHHFKKQTLTHLFQQLHNDPNVIKSITQPFEKESWTKYRGFFLTHNRIHSGAAYWQTHHRILTKMRKKYGVPPKVIIAIIGVETSYGQNVGDYPVLNTLYTLAFHYPPRAHFFKKELAQYLLLTRENHLPVLKLKGSYAGALGIPQFMPSSYRYYGTSPSGKKKVNINLFQDNGDAIASVANYLKKSGWRRGKPIAIQIHPNPKTAQKLKTLRMRKRYTMSTFKRWGVKLPIKLSNKTLGSMVIFQDKKTDEYWIIFKNFRVIMQYNHNATYAMAVYQLSQEIKKRYDSQKRSRTATSTR